MCACTVVDLGTHDCVREHVADMCTLNTCVSIIIIRKHRVWLRSYQSACRLISQAVATEISDRVGEVAEGQWVTIHRSPGRGQRDQSGDQPPFIT